MLRVDEVENLAMIGDSVAHLRAAGRNAEARLALEEGRGILIPYVEQYSEGPYLNLLEMLERDLEALKR